MAGTTFYYGVTYPTSTDYVTDGATAIEAVADGFDAAVAIPTYNNQTGTTYTFVLLDAAKVVSSNNASAVTFTIPPQSSVVWTTGATLTVANYGAGTLTIAAGAGVTLTNSTATVAQFASATIVRTGSNAWTVIPFAGGALPLRDSAVTGTTGSPATATYTNVLNYKTYTFTGSGSITFNKAGLVDVLVVGGGGACGEATRGAGAGGFISVTDFYVTAAAQTVTIGASVTGSNRGNESVFRNLVAVGGGRGGGIASGYGNVGGSGGASATPLANERILNQGNLGGSGGGGGSGGAGGASAGGVGTSSSIRANTPVTYAAGGSSTTPTTATANTGNGAGGSATTNTSGSGIVIVRVLQ
jgi:hypothetical protein